MSFLVVLVPTHLIKILLKTNFSDLMNNRKVNRKGYFLVACEFRLILIVPGVEI